MTIRDESRILLVDDDPDICINLSDILNDLGYQVDSAHNGPSAMELLRQRPYDVALLDLKMPGMDGLKLQSEIKKQRPGVVSLLVTAHVSPAATLEAIAAGMWKVVNKPVDFRALLRLLNEALQQPTVLVIDDNRSLCANLWDLLRDRGFRVSLAHDGFEAARQLAESKFKVVLIDMCIPHGDGRQMFRMVRESNPSARTIVITGFRSEMAPVISEMLEQGANAVYYKPFDVPELFAKLDELVRAERGAGDNRG